MPNNGYSLRASLWQTLTRTRRSDAPWWVVIRNTAAVIVPLGAGLASGHTAIGLGVAAGALNVMFSDQPGPYRQRIVRLVLAALAIGLAALVGFVVGDALTPLLLATLAFGFCGGLLVMFGVDIARVGMGSMIVLVITAAQPAPLTRALEGAALMFGGGLLLGALSIVAWPLQRYRPERAALARVYRDLSSLARLPPPQVTDAPPAGESMNVLQQMLLGHYRARGRAMEAFIVLLDLAERIRLQLVALADQADATALPPTLTVDVASVLEQIASALDSGESPRAAERALATLEASERALIGQRGTWPTLAAPLHALIGQLAAAVRNADWAGSRGELRAAVAEHPLPRRLRSSAALATLRANFTPDSVAFQHAVRSAVALTAALLLSRALKLPHGYWLPMTVAIVLRPDFAATFSFGLLRVVGTVLGLLLTTALLYVTPDQPWAHLALMAALCVAFRYMATVHYGVAVAALTGAVVILLSFEGVAPGAAVIDRVINTAFGSALALLAYAAWPTWERAHTATAQADLLVAYTHYLEALADADKPDQRRAARIEARRARTNAQASLERLRAEPGVTHLLLEKSAAVVANSHRLARTAMALEAALYDRPELPEAPEVRGLLQRSANALQQCALTLRHHGNPPREVNDLRQLQRSLAQLLRLAEDRAAANELIRLCDRLVDNIDTLGYVVGRPVPAASPAAHDALRH